MAWSSPARNGHPASSPERHAFSPFLNNDRNNEDSLRDALVAAQAEHERVRAAAVRVYHLHEVQQRRKEITDMQLVEQKRLEEEARLVAEEKRLRELKALSVPKLPAEPEPEPPRPQPPKPAPPAAEPAKFPPKQEPTPQQQNVEDAGKKTPFGPSASLPSAGFPPASAAQQPNGTSVPAGPSAKPPVLQNQPAPKSNGFPVQAAVAPKQPTAVAAPNPQAALVQRYSQIHQELKSLRKNLQAMAKTAGPPLKSQIGVFRREIRVSIGQLTGGKGANAAPVSSQSPLHLTIVSDQLQMNKITTALREALSGRVPSPPVEVGLYVLSPREPVEGATNNEPTLPSLFIYLVNICAKGIVNQYINECGANPKAADPIGVFAAQIFSMKEFHWRGQSLIDILMAKFRVVCPILFGLRGNDKMEKGRLALGWKKDGSGWESEQSHNDRMTGLGAGYASLALRDFSKASKTNPYPPTNYWTALAGLVNTPQGEVSNTHFVVLRAMIEGYEQRFLTFYGNAGLAALRLALVEFPKKAPKDATAAGSLTALAEVLRSEAGLVFG
ncbi:Nucleoporin GLE1 [Paramyrothecium foliicola]|nr:Nucleoporin GLE1 [Paramyrothecium foliicola]